MFVQFKLTKEEEKTYKTQQYVNSFIKKMYKCTQMSKNIFNLSQMLT